MNKAVLVGADPELFLCNEQGKFISAIGLIGGSKFVPRQMGGGYAIQEDNVAAEYNIPPAKSAEEFVKSLNIGREFIEKEISKYGLRVAYVPSVVFEEDQLRDPNSWVFGCEADLNAWTRKTNRRPKAKDKNLRSAGGHVHMQSKADPFLLGRWCDALLGAPFVLVDNDTRRRELYGRAGSIRIKPYPGIEYRVLSNKWLETDELKAWVYEQTCKAVDNAESGKKISQADGRAIVKAINSSSVKMARELQEKFDFGPIPF